MLGLCGLRLAFPLRCPSGLNRLVRRGCRASLLAHQDICPRIFWECIGRDGYLRIRDNLSSAFLSYEAFKRICAGEKHRPANKVI
jgi:hypothetical protein